MSMEDPSQKARKWAKGTSKKYLGKKIALERLTSSHSRDTESAEKEERKKEKKSSPLLLSFFSSSFINQRSSFHCGELELENFALGELGAVYIPIARPNVDLSIDRLIAIHKAHWRGIYVATIGTISARNHPIGF